MQHTSRRHFLAATGSGVLASAVAYSNRPANACIPDDTPENQSSTKPPRIYELGKIPRVDIHMHIKFPQLELTGKFIEAIDV